MRFIFLSFLVAANAFATPSCLIDAEGPLDMPLRRITGRVLDFSPEEPVFVTISNAGHNYTTKAARDGSWALLIGNFSPENSLLCWQGYESAKAALSASR